MAARRDGCSCAMHGSTASQTLQEMDFERGLWQAASDGDTERVEKLLTSGHIVNTKDSSGYTPLHYGCRNGHLVICKTLLASGAHVNSQTPGGATGLHRAAYCGHREIVELLVLHGADGNVTDSDGKTPLHKACEAGQIEVVRELANKFPGTIEMTDKRGRLPKELVKNWNKQWHEILHHQ